MPVPSSGCHTCKTRRIKCDGGLPKCKRCITSRRLCHRMESKQSHTIIHIENPYASGQNKRPRGPRPVPRLSGSLNAALQGPAVDLKTQAICYYVNHHLRAPTDVPNVPKSTAESFMPLWAIKEEFPILDLALSSMTLAVYSKTYQYSPAGIEACSTYHRLLRLVQASMPSLIYKSVDVCLFTIFFMGRYEDSVHDDRKVNPNAAGVPKFRSFSHHDGALAVLQIWKNHLSHSQPATEIIKHVRRGLLRSALMRNRAVPEWMIDGACFGEQGLDLEYDRVIIRITIVRVRLMTLLLKQARLPCVSLELLSEAEELSEEMRDIDNALEDWTSHFPSAWSPRQHTLPKGVHWSREYLYSPTVYSYQNPSCAAVWNKYYATRMLATSVRLRVLELYHPDLEGSAYKQRLECTSIMKAMSGCLLSTIPFCLERFKVIETPTLSTQEVTIVLNTKNDMKPYMASEVTWPLTIASCVRDVDTDQRLWFKSTITWLGKVIGSGVIQCGYTQKWLEI